MVPIYEFFEIANKRKWIHLFSLTLMNATKDHSVTDRRREPVHQETIAVYYTNELAIDACASVDASG